jgi:hypothetical protein
MAQGSTTGAMFLSSPYEQARVDLYRPSTISIDLRHEIGSPLRDSMLTEVALVPPSATPTTVIVNSSVATSGAQRLRSPAYMASIRRRKTAAIAKEIASLKLQEGAEDFSVYTLPIVEGLRAAISTLHDAEAEGNAREVLRLLRDTFLNGGWGKYRQPEARSAAIALLKELASSEEVEPELASGAFDDLAEVGLNPVAFAFPDGDDEVSG